MSHLYANTNSKGLFVLNNVTVRKFLDLEDIDRIEEI